jgi:hypothetical protein
VVYHANTVPDGDKENKRMWNAYVSANYPNCTRIAYVLMRALTLVTEIVANSGILVPRGYR